MGSWVLKTNRVCALDDRKGIYTIDWVGRLWHKRILDGILDKGRSHWVGLTRISSQLPVSIWMSDVTFVTFFGDKKYYASYLSHFWEECDALAHENIFFNFRRFLSHPSRKTSHFGPAGTKKNWTGRNVTIGLGLKHVFLFPSSFVTYLGSVKHEGHLG